MPSGTDLSSALTSAGESPRLKVLQTFPAQPSSTVNEISHPEGRERGNVKRARRGFRRFRPQFILVSRRLLKGLVQVELNAAPCCRSYMTAGCGQFNQTLFGGLKMHNYLFCYCSNMFVCCVFINVQVENIWTLSA